MCINDRLHFCCIHQEQHCITAIKTSWSRQSSQPVCSVCGSVSAVCVYNMDVLSHLVMLSWEPWLHSRRRGQFQTSCFRFQLPPPLAPKTHAQRSLCLISQGVSGSASSGVRIQESSPVAGNVNIINITVPTGGLSQGRVSLYLSLSTSDTHTHTRRWNRSSGAHVAHRVSKVTLSTPQVSTTKP